MKTEKTTQFIRKAIILNGNLYDYSLVDYKNNRTKIKIICKKHGLFNQTPYGHLSGKHCSECAGNKKFSTEEFIKKSKEIHGDIFDYSKVFYNGANEKVKIKCTIHGFFEQIPYSHLKGFGCTLCKNKKISKSLTSNKEDFIIKAKNTHNNTYDYSLVEYVSATKKVNITCSTHGQFTQTPNSHLTGIGCPKCGNSKKWHSRQITTEEFIRKAKKTHGETYDYSLSIYNKSTNGIKIKCSKHGVFLQKANNHLSGCGCPKCKTSKGELAIEKLLSENKINYIKQKRFKDCRDKLPLPFDFYLTDYNVCIEYDGAFHFKPIKNRGGIKAFEKTKLHDKIKTEYCKNNQITLYRISSKKQTENILNLL